MSDNIRYDKTTAYCLCGSIGVPARGATLPACGDRKSVLKVGDSSSSSGGDGCTNSACVQRRKSFVELVDWTPVVRPQLVRRQADRRDILGRENAAVEDGDEPFNGDVRGARLPVNRDQLTELPNQAKLLADLAAGRGIGCLLRLDDPAWIAPSFDISGVDDQHPGVFVEKQCTRCLAFARQLETPMTRRRFYRGHRRSVSAPGEVDPGTRCRSPPPLTLQDQPRRDRCAPISNEHTGSGNSSP